MGRWFVLSLELEGPGVDEWQIDAAELEHDISRHGLNETLNARGLDVGRSGGAWSDKPAY